jgi:hypothetical protein
LGFDEGASASNRAGAIQRNRYSAQKRRAALSWVWRMLRSPASLAGMSSWIFLRYAGLFFGLALWKSPHIFKHPRFWAEEGSRFYAHCQGGSFWHCMEYVHGDSYHLLANTLVSLAAAASVEDAPAVTTYLAFAVELAVVVQIVLFCSEYRLSPLIAALLVAAWAMLPGRYGSVA